MTSTGTRCVFWHIIFLFLLFNLCATNTHNVLSEDLISAFGPTHCMHLYQFENILTQPPDEPRHLKHEYANESIVVDELYNINPADNVNKMLKLMEKEHQSPIAMVNELCQINKLKKHFYLLSKDGPAHKLLFKVALDFIDESGNVVENYYGEGSQIKLAQRKAAEDALINTNYKHPTKNKNKDKPSKDYILYNIATIDKNHISLLHELGQKLDKPIDFETIEDGPSHQKIFKTTCTFDKYKGYGESTKKKISKKLAAEDLTSQLKLIPTHDSIFKSDSKNKKKKKKGRRKISSFRSIKNLGSQLYQWINTASDNQIVHELKDNKIDSANDVKSNSHSNTNNGLESKTDIDPNARQKHGKNVESKSGKEATSKNQLTRFAEISGIKLKYYDINEKNGGNYVSFVRLTSKPHIICYGEAPNAYDAQEKCSDFAFDYLFEMYNKNGTLILENLQQSIKIGLHTFKNELPSKRPVDIFKQSLDQYEYDVDPVMLTYNMAKWKNNTQI